MPSMVYPNANDDGMSPAVQNSKVPTPSSAAVSSKDKNIPKYVDEPGPTDKRSVKDIPALILFILFFIGLIIISGLAISNGNVARLKYGNDTEGNLCGVSNSGGRDLTSSPYQYVFNPLSRDSYRKCVNSCPANFTSIICKYGVSSPSSITPTSTYADWKAFYDQYGGNCTFTMKTKLVLNRCVPDVSEVLKFTSSSSLNYTQGNQVATQIFSDIYDSWQVILACSFIALFFSFVWLFLMQLFAPIIVWFTITFVNIVGIGFTAYLWWNYYNIQKGNSVDAKISELVASGKYNQDVLLGLAVIFTISSVAIFVLTVGLRKRIGLAINLIKETSKAIRAIPLVIFFPIWKYIALLALTAWVIYTWAMLVTSGQKVTSKLNNVSETSFEANNAFQFLTIYVAFGYFWIFNWIIAIAQCTIAGAIASWYWTRDKKALARFPVWASFKRVMRYHLGSLAFGSLILGIIQTIRAILLYLQMTLNKHKESKTVKVLLACLQCCFACLDKFMKFLSKNAYIEIAIYGYSFWQGAKIAFALLVRNAVRLVVVNRVGGFVFFLGKLLITMGTCLIGAIMLQPSSSNDESRFWAVPLIIIGVISYIIASSFMAVVDMTIDTLFLCFCEDSERNDGKGKPYFMPESLRKFVDESTKAAPKI